MVADRQPGRLNTAYIDAELRPILRQSVVSYVDQLGVTNQLLDFNNDDLARWALRIDSVRDTIEDPLGSECATLVFSDNFITAAPLSSQRPGGSGADAIPMMIGAFQCRAALEGDFYRGAIVVGDIHVGVDRAIGPALVSAYDAENRVAVHPRILVSQDCLSALQNDLGSDSSNLLTIDADGEVFLNYLMDVNCFFDPGPEERLAAHRDVVTGALLRFHNTPRVRSKYVWVAQYHNWYSETMRFPSDLQISDGLTSWERHSPRKFTKYTPPLT